MTICRRQKATCVTIPIQPDYLQSLVSQETDQATNQTNQVPGNALSDKKTQVLNLFTDNPTMTQSEAAVILGGKLSLVKYYVNSLKKEGKLERIGTSQN